MGMYRKKGIILGLMWHGDNFDEINRLIKQKASLEYGLLYIKTPAGVVSPDIGDMVMCDEVGNVSSYKMDVFPKVYEEINE